MTQAPHAPARPVTLQRHGVSWQDEYAWLRDPAYPKVEDEAIRSYLEAENAFFREAMAPLRPLVERLHAEMKGRIRDDDSSVPAPDGAFAYFWRYARGAQYRTWYRRPRDGGEDVVLLDEAALAEGKGFFNLRSLKVSPDDRLLAWTTDEDGSERYAIHLRELEGGRTFGRVRTNTSGSLAWSADGSVLFYVELNDKLRPFRVRAHRIGAGEDEDRIVFEETDPAFFVSIGRTQSRRFIVIESGDHVTSETRLVDARAPLDPPRLVAARRAGHRYSVEHAGERLFILTNDTHENFRLVSAPVATPEEAHWREEIAGSDDDYLLDVTCFAGFMAITGRTAGLSTIRVRTYDGESHAIDFGEPVYTARLGENRMFDTGILRLGFSSLTTPGTVFDYHVAGRRLETRKVQEIPSGYDPSLYESERLWATAPDGERIPISLVRRKDAPRGAEGRLLLYGYGAYGMGMEPGFSPLRLGLLDRGFAYAIAHVRGGDEMGYRWYRKGRLADKPNTFADFIACAERLVEAGFCAPGNIAIRGGSAGGMLMGAVTNMRPDLWRCVIAEVPFVDVLNTMLDASLPLTPIEWPEWGNPLESPADFELIRGYCPYTNIRAADYPDMLVTAGIADPRVTYWEPAKYVARLRARKTNDRRLFLKTNMGAGHFGASGRFDALEEQAEVLAFILECFGLARGELEALAPARAAD